MGEGVGCDQEIEGLDGNAPSPEEVPEFARLFPQVRWLIELVTALE